MRDWPLVQSLIGLWAILGGVLPAQRLFHGQLPPGEGVLLVGGRRVKERRRKTEERMREERKEKKGEERKRKEEKREKEEKGKEKERKKREKGRGGEKKEKGTDSELGSPLALKDMLGAGGRLGQLWK